MALPFDEFYFGIKPTLESQEFVLMNLKRLLIIIIIIVIQNIFYEDNQAQFQIEPKCSQKFYKYRMKRCSPFESLICGCIIWKMFVCFVMGYDWCTSVDNLSREAYVHWTGFWSILCIEQMSLITNGSNDSKWLNT